MRKKIILPLVAWLVITIAAVWLLEVWSGIFLVLPILYFIFMSIYYATLKCPHCEALLLVSSNSFSLDVPILSVACKNECPSCGKSLKSSGEDFKRKKKCPEHSE